MYECMANLSMYKLTLAHCNAWKKKCLEWNSFIAPLVIINACTGRTTKPRYFQTTCTQVTNGTKLTKTNNNDNNDMYEHLAVNTLDITKEKRKYDIEWPRRRREKKLARSAGYQ